MTNRPFTIAERSVVMSRDPFLPRDAMLSAVYAVVVCLSVCVCVSVNFFTLSSFKNFPNKINFRLYTKY